MPEAHAPRRSAASSFQGEQLIADGKSIADTWQVADDLGAEDLSDATGDR